MAVTINGSTGVTSPEFVLDNAAADGGQVVLKSSGYSNWNWDNYSGRLRAYYNATEYFAIDSSGNVLVGATSTSAVTSGGFAVLPNSNQSYTATGHVSGTGSGAYYHACYYNGSLVGGVTQSGTTGVVLTSISDYRLKENIVSLQGSLAKVLELRPCTYTWKADGSEGEGFIAHELQAVIPSAATGTKDEVDEDGNAKYQGINVSAIVPHLVKAIQELKAELDATKAEVAALKGIK